jgi:hypothetical protein
MDRTPPVKEQVAKKIAGLRTALIAAVVAAAVAVFVTTNIVGRHSGEVQVHSASSDAPIGNDSTTNTEAPVTTTSAPAATTTTVAPEIVKRVVVVEKKVEDVDQRVKTIEQQTGISTTSTAPPGPVVTLDDDFPSDGAGNWLQDFSRVYDFKTTVSKPGLAVTFEHNTKDGLKQYTVVFPDGALKVETVVPAAEVGPGVTGPGNISQFTRIVGWTWDGGSHTS